MDIRGTLKKIRADIMDLDMRVGIANAALWRCHKTVGQQEALSDSIEGLSLLGGGSSIEFETDLESSSLDEERDHGDCARRTG